MDSVKVCIVGKSEVMMAMRRVTELADIKIVETMAEADLVVAESVRDIEANFNKDKYYAIITLLRWKKPGAIYQKRICFSGAI